MSRSKKQAIQEMEAEKKKLRTQIERIEQRITGDNLSTETWFALVQNRNHLLNKLEMLSRKIACRISTGSNHGHEITLI